MCEYTAQDIIRGKLVRDWRSVGESKLERDEWIGSHTWSLASVYALLVVVVVVLGVGVGAGVSCCFDVASRAARSALSYR